MSVLQIPIIDKPTKDNSLSDIGKGFKLNIAKGEDAFKGHVFKPQNFEFIPIGKTYAESAVVDSEESAKSILDIKGELSISYSPMVSGEASGAYMSSVMSSQSKCVILYRAYNQCYAKNLLKMEPTDEVSQFFTLGQQPELVAQFGTMFVQQIICGSALEISYVIQSKNNSSVSDIRAELKAKFGSGLLSVEFSTAFRNLQESHSASHSFQITAKAIGSKVSVPAQPKPEDVREIVDKFNKEQEEANSAAFKAIKLAEKEGRMFSPMDSLPPVSLAIGSIADYKAPLGQEEAAVLNTKMERLSDVLHCALLWKTKLKTHAAEIEDYAKDKPEVWENHVKYYLDAVIKEQRQLDAKIEACLKFRQFTIAQIVDKGGYQTEAKVPTKYPQASDRNRLQGLCGQGYLTGPGFIWTGYVVNGAPGWNGKGCKYGDGKYQDSDGKVWEGQWKDGQLQKGKFTCSSGETYEGEFKDGTFNGKGKHTKTDGSVFEGEYKDGNGIKGKYTYVDGEVYEGQWKDRTFNGKGKYTWTCGTAYEGEYKDGKMNGKGKYTWPSGAVHEGEYKEGKMNGNGKKTFSNGAVYEGEFKDDKANGKGKMTFSNGAVYEGEFKDDKANGKGKMTFSNGAVYEGEWKDDKANGKGKMTFANGTVQEGEWKDDAFQN
eukprot:TRINITY_DN1097_c0_g1_i5.p1 TRINITY_DN1097_c0_g1~~TRINITY_DN1097_c0_g1_i5.p1  ORF type:complete len:658 (+),score=129.00 TRINITY_DN1097_c0_g1_i5:222-2195(+)